MKKLVILLPFFCLAAVGVMAIPIKKFNLMIAPGTVTENSVTLLWDKQPGKDSTVYEISANRKVVGATSKTNYTAANLLPATSYTIGFKTKGDATEFTTLRFKTAAKGKLYNILDYGAKEDSATKNTRAKSSYFNCAKAWTMMLFIQVYPGTKSWERLLAPAHKNR